MDKEEHIKEIKKREAELNKIIKTCEKNQLSGILFHRDLGHIIFLNKESDRHMLIELAKTEDEFVKQKRGFLASQMLKSHLDNAEKIRQNILGNKKTKPSYMG